MKYFEKHWDKHLRKEVLALGREAVSSYYGYVHVPLLTGVHKVQGTLRTTSTRKPHFSSDFSYTSSETAEDPRPIAR